MKVSNITEKASLDDTVNSLTTGDDTDSVMLRAGPPYPPEDVPKVKVLQQASTVQGQLELFVLLKQIMTFQAMPRTLELLLLLK